MTRFFFVGGFCFYIYRWQLTSVFFMFLLFFLIVKCPHIWINSQRFISGVDLISLTVIVNSSD